MAAALVAAFNVQKLLLAGVTGFLDADCLWNLGPALRDAIEAGIVDGPRMTSGMNALLTAAGGTAGRLIPDSGTAAYVRRSDSTAAAQSYVAESERNQQTWAGRCFCAWLWHRKQQQRSTPSTTLKSRPS